MTPKGPGQRNGRGLPRCGSMSTRRFRLFFSAIRASQADGAPPWKPLTSRTTSRV